VVVPAVRHRDVDQVETARHPDVALVQIAHPVCLVRLETAHHPDVGQAETGLVDGHLVAERLRDCKLKIEKLRKIIIFGNYEYLSWLGDFVQE